MAIDIKITDEKEWNTVIENQRLGTIFHTWKWLKLLEKYTNSKLYSIVGLKGDTIIGIYPLFYQKKSLLNFVFSPPPYVAVPYLGPAIVDYDKLKQDKKEFIFWEFQKKVDEYLKYELRPTYIQISLTSDLLDTRPFKWAGYNVEPKYNYIFDLSKGADSLWANFKKNLRQNINRAKRRGIYAEESSKKEDLEWIFETTMKRYNEQGKVFYPSKDYLLDLYDTFYPQNMKIFVAMYNGEVVSGLVDLYYKNKVVSWLGNIKVNLKRVTPNEVLQWEAIKSAIEHDMKYYIEMGANTKRLCAYKSKYNPDLLLSFSAKKYASKIPKLVESTYFNVLKPLQVIQKVKVRGIFNRNSRVR